MEEKTKEKAEEKTELERELSALLASIRPADEAAKRQARARQDSLAKPPKSLGKLEELSVQLAGVTGKLNNSVKKRRILIFCADNGVVEEGVSSAPKSVTLAQTINFTRGKTGVAALAKEFGVDLTVIDMGIDGDVPEGCGVLNRKIRRGTWNLAKRPAMAREEALRAMLTGAQCAKDAKAAGCDALGVGEMGIGNTTTSSAVLSALTGLSVEKTAGKGGGLEQAAFQKKKRVIAQALARWEPDRSDPIDVLSKVGGFDLAAMTGAFLGAAESRIPAVIDGFISAVAALCAVRLCPAVREYLVPSHASYEIGYGRAMEEIGLSPLLLLDMRLGEGSGCVLAFEVLRAACAAMNGMATFEEAQIDDGYLAPIRENESFRVEPDERTANEGREAR